MRATTLIAQLAENIRLFGDRDVIIQSHDGTYGNGFSNVPEVPVIAVVGAYSNQPVRILATGEPK